MNRNLIFALSGMLAAACCLAATLSQSAEPASGFYVVAAQPTPAPQMPCPMPASTSTPAPERTPGSDLNSVLRAMDESSAAFRSAQAEVELVQCTAVVHDKDLQTGEIFFRRKGHETDVALWIAQPHAKQAVVKDDKLTFYDPKTKQLTDRRLGNNKADVEAVMNLGFGGRGQELLKEYDVTLAGWEIIDGVRTARLELVAKSPKLRQFFTKVVLWIDPGRDVALQQQRFESSGDYQLTHYSHIQLNPHIPSDKFEIAK